MPKSKRLPIDYKPQFGAGLFRSQETVAQELAELEEASPDTAASASTLDPDDGVAVLSEDQGKDVRESASRRQSGSRRTNGSTNVRSFERSEPRTRVRHSFDIWQDQLLGLSEIQSDRFSRTGRKPKLGELVQEALDAYITKERRRTNEGTNER